MTKVSVVVPTYNRAGILPRTIDSVLNQTVEDTEIIVIDDASTDNTESVLKSYGDQIKYYQHKKNQGGSAARNTGIGASNGEYIAFLDSDDTWEPSKLEKQIKLLERRGSEWIAAYCNFEQKRENKIVEIIDNLFQRPTGYEGDDEIIGRIFLRRISLAAGSTVIVKKEVLESIGGFDESFDRNQDLEFMIRLLSQGKIGFVNEILVTIYDTGRPHSTTTKESMQRFNNKFEKNMREHEVYEEANMIQNFMLAKLYFEEGKFYNGVQSLRKSKVPHHRDVLGLIVSAYRGIQ